MATSIASTATAANSNYNVPVTGAVHFYTDACTFSSDFVQTTIGLHGTSKLTNDRQHAVCT